MDELTKTSTNKSW